MISWTKLVMCMSLVGSLLGSCWGVSSFLGTLLFDGLGGSLLPLLTVVVSSLLIMLYGVMLSVSFLEAVFLCLVIYDSSVVGSLGLYLLLFGLGMGGLGFVVLTCCGGGSVPMLIMFVMVLLKLGLGLVAVLLVSGLPFIYGFMYCLMTDHMWLGLVLYAKKACLLGYLFSLVAGSYPFLLAYLLGYMFLGVVTSSSCEGYLFTLYSQETLYLVMSSSVDCGFVYFLVVVNGFLLGSFYVFSYSLGVSDTCWVLFGFLLIFSFFPFPVFYVKLLTISLVLKCFGFGSVFWLLGVGVLGCLQVSFLSWGSPELSEGLGCSHGGFVLVLMVVIMGGAALWVLGAMSVFSVEVVSDLEAWSLLVLVLFSLSFKYMMVSGFGLSMKGYSLGVFLVLFGVLFGAFFMSSYTGLGLGDWSLLGLLLFVLSVSAFLFLWFSGS